MAIYQKDTLLDKTTVREDLPNSALELICVEIKPINAASCVCFDIFNQIEESRQFFDREDKEYILLGDTNCDILPKYSKEGNADSIEFIEFRTCKANSKQ